jgi:Trk K+ transport system NAD-binding subunit
MNPKNLQRTAARVVIALKQNRLALLFVGAWLFVSTLAFATAHPFVDALLLALTLRHAPDELGRLYAGFTEVVVFGAVISVVIANVTRRWRPEATAAELARHARDHFVVVGRSHLGERVRALALAAGAEVVVIDTDRARVGDLIEAEEPVVLGSARDEGVLGDAAVARAAVVVVATDDLDEAAIACRAVRARNPRCELVVRFADDDVGKALARAHGARAISTSRLAASHIAERAARIGARRAVVCGANGLARRVTATLRDAGLDVVGVASEHELVAAPLAEAHLVVFADDDLGTNLVYADRVRDVNATVEIVARVFHEDAAEILARAPFRCTLLSTSRLAAESLVREGLLRRVQDPDARAARAAHA